MILEEAFLMAQVVVKTKCTGYVHLMFNFKPSHGSLDGAC